MSEKNTPGEKVKSYGELTEIVFIRTLEEIKNGERVFLLKQNLSHSFGVNDEDSPLEEKFTITVAKKDSAKQEIKINRGWEILTSEQVLNKLKKPNTTAKNYVILLANKIIEEN